MVDHQTRDKMQQLRLFGMLEALENLSNQSVNQDISFGEGMRLCLDAESNYRDTKRLNRLMKTAKIRYQAASIESINTEHKRDIPENDWRWLINGNWITQHQNIIFNGPAGIGKTYLACACANLACRKGINTRYFRLTRLLDELRMAHADGSYSKLLTSLLKAKCLIIDDWGIPNISQERRADLLEIIDDSYEERSVIIATQLPVNLWHEYIGDNTIADAILDRVIHQAKIFTLKGDSMRKKLHHLDHYA